MSNTLLNRIDNLVDEGKIHLNEINFILNDLLKTSMNVEDMSDEDKILSIQFALQYRLICEDALSFLLKMDHNLLYFLGIQPQHSAEMDLDRLAWAIGSEDLKQILSVLAILTGSLSKLVSRYKNTHASFAIKDKKPHKQHLIVRELTSLLTKQKQLVDIIEKMDLDIEQLVKLQAAGPLFDHIAALRGPISHFHQAIIHGLGQAEQLYHQLNKTPVLDYQLNSLIKETQHVLHLMPAANTPHPNHPIKQFDHPMSSEQIEQRATAKRLRPFFG
jgi:hypothetical protein